MPSCSEQSASSNIYCWTLFKAGTLNPALDILPTHFVKINKMKIMCTSEMHLNINCFLIKIYIIMQLTKPDLQFFVMLPPKSMEYGVFLIITFLKFKKI